MKLSLNVCLVLSAVVLGSMASAAHAQQTSVAEQYLFNALNAERVQRHLKPVRWDAALYRAASLHADAMAAHGTISHQFSGEPELTERGAKAGAHFSVISENVAMAPNAVEIHDLWMKSPHHRDNILDGAVNQVAIRVVRRNGELFAVEDFDHVVANLSLSEQEEQVAILVQSAMPIEMLPWTEDARRTCSMSNGYAGKHRPWFVIRFTAGELDRLPDTLVDKLASGRYRQAAVGACPANGRDNFSTYNVAVLLYP
jgi:hypothetical protein